ncbi:MAG: prolyl aminopeptidase [Burkholderiaceae bacterium]|nr:prolyl aminopeptidase [Burkholderiaceae bacterium]
MSDASAEAALFPAIEPYETGMMAVDELHTLYWEQCGNPHGTPVLFLHGGPGGGLSTAHRRFFDPAHYRIVLFDQRGAGKSTPLGEFRHNTTHLLIHDIERLRMLLGIEQWLVFGGSWGSTLALAYGQAHPQHCLGFVLRGIFLCTRTEVEWFVNGIKWFYPEVHAEFASHIPEAERGDLLNAYKARLFSDDPDVYFPAARAWARYEGSCVYLLSHPEALAEYTADGVALGIGRLEAHYLLNEAFLEEDQLVHNVGRIRHLPAVIVQGRYDVVCPPASAYRLHQAWPEAKYQVVPDAGHAALEPGIAAALVAATQQFKQQRRFE